MDLAAGLTARMGAGDLIQSLREDVMQTKPYIQCPIQKWMRKDGCAMLLIEKRWRERTIHKQNQHLQYESINTIACS